MATTRTLKRQRGMVIMQHATGDLRLIINELDVATLTDEQGDDKVRAHIRDAFQEYLEKATAQSNGTCDLRPRV